MATHLKFGKWRPPSDADARLADILTRIEPKEASRLGEELFARTTWTLPDHLGFANPVGFSVRHPVAALDTRGRDMHTSRVVTVDRTGVRSTLYEGPAQHWSLCAVDSETVIARREFDSGGVRGDTEIVEYTPGREAVLASGGGLLDAVVEATATGFVVGTKLSRVAFALADGQQEQLDLREFGFRRADLFAVDATGTRIAFADGARLLVTDSRLQPLHDIVVESPLRRSEINAITFTEDSIVTADYNKGLYRWQIIGGRIRGLHSGSHSSPRTFFRLNPVAPWNLLVAEGGNVNYHYDIATLERCPAPNFLVQAGPDDNDDLRAPHAIGKFLSSAYGRLAVYEGALATRTRASVTDFYSTVIQDLEHPLNILTKPVCTLNAVDADRVRPHLNPSSGTGDTYHLTATEQAVLGSAVEACEWASKVTGG